MNEKIKILIVEDNVIIADDLRFTLENLGYEVIACLIAYEETISFLEKNSIDLAFLDISLATKKTGIDIASYINEHIKVPFIYLTSNSDDATIRLAAKTNPSAYLVKPFDSNNLKAAIEIAINNYVSSDLNLIEKFVFVKKNEFHQKILINDISYIKSDNVYLELHCKENSKHLLRSTLKSFIEKLPESFLQCHKSYIINLNYVGAFNTKFVIVNTKKIPISSQFKGAFKNFIG